MKYRTRRWFRHQTRVIPRVPRISRPRSVASPHEASRRCHRAHDRRAGAVRGGPSRSGAFRAAADALTALGRSSNGPSAAPVPVVIGAAGDVACASAPTDQQDHCRYDDTADLLVGLSGILVLGDGQYETGTFQAYTTYYGPTWGRYLDRTFPVPGNHDYGEDPHTVPMGYFRYFGDRVRGPDGLGYYSFDLPTGCTPGREVCWHLIALSSEEVVFRQRWMRPRSGMGPIQGRATGCTGGSETTSDRTRTSTTPARWPIGTIRCSRSPTGAVRRRRPGRSGRCSTTRAPTSC